MFEEPARLQVDDKAVLACEETAVTRRIVVRERIIELSTIDDLKLLEAEQRIQSADAVLTARLHLVAHRQGWSNLGSTIRRSGRQRATRCRRCTRPQAR